MRVADFIIDFLVSKGVSTAFVLTGNGAMFLDDAASMHPGLEIITVRNEANAPAMAAAHYRISERPALVLVTSGPGAANAMSGVVEAWVDGSPVFVLAGQAELPGKFEADAAPRTFGLAGVPAAQYVEEFTKYSGLMHSASVAHEMLEDAWVQMLDGQPGPVWLDVPGSVQAAQIPREGIAAVKRGGYISAVEAIPAEVCDGDQVQQLMSQSQRPLVVLGQGARQCKFLSQLLAVCQDNHVPVALTRPAADIVAHTHPAVVGVIGVRASLASPWLVGESDLLLLLGARDSESLLGVEKRFVSENAHIIQVTLEATSAQRLAAGQDISILSSLESWLAHNLQTIAATLHSNDSWWERCRLLPDLGQLIPQECGGSDELDLYWVMRRIHDSADRGDVLVTDAGSNYYVGGQVFTHSNGTRELTSHTFAAMGLSLPIAIGAASALGDKGTVWATTGDGSIELSVQELSTLNLTRFNIKLFVINNGGHLSMRIWQDTFFDGRRIGSDDASGGSVVNFRALAEAFGVKYVPIRTGNDLDEHLARARRSGGPELIEVFCNPSQRIARPTFSAKAHSEDV